MVCVLSGMGLAACCAVLYWATVTGARDENIVQEARMMKVLENYNKLKMTNKANSNNNEEDNTNIVRPKTSIRTGVIEQVATVTIGMWFRDNVLPSLVTQGITGILKAPSAYLKNKQAQEADAILTAKNETFQKEVVTLQKELLGKLEAGFNNLQEKGQLLTPTTFLEMLAHLELPPTQVEAFRAMANQVIIAVNDNKPLQNNLLDYGLIELSKAQQFKRAGELKIAQIPLDAGIQAISSALPDMHSMLHYKAHHTLTQLHQTTAEVQTALGNPEKAAAALEAANITHKFALLDGNSARFVAGFLEGLINYQGTQFSGTQTQTLKRLLNFVANDVIPIPSLNSV
jgi:hypothetical protein